MRVALISDLHANLVALDAVLADVARAGVDEVVCLGDVVDLGPQPTETVARLRDLGCVCIQGNHDPLDEAPELPLLREIEAWTRDRLTVSDRAWLDALPAEVELDLGGRRLLCVHGSPRSFRDNILDSTPLDVLRDWFEGRQFDMLAAGHTHVQLLRRVERRLIVNVGSVGQPFERAFDGPPPRALPWAEYAIVGAAADTLSVDLRRVAVDQDAFRRSVRDAGFPRPDEWLAQWG